MSCPAGAEQQWWLTNYPSGREFLKIQGRECGGWLAFMEEGAWARYDDVDLGTGEGEMRLRLVVAADDAFTHGGTLNLFADSDMTTAVNTCLVKTTGGWFNWVVVDCGPLSLKGPHSLTFKFSRTDRTDQYSFNLAAFGVVRSGSPDCTVTGPKLVDRAGVDDLR